MLKIFFLRDGETGEKLLRRFEVINQKLSQARLDGTLMVRCKVHHSMPM